MIILKYSFLDKKNGIVKTLCFEKKKYGMYHLPSATTIINPKYDYIYSFDCDKAVVKNNGYCYQIDRSGNEYFDIYQTIEEYEGGIEIIDKGDTCPSCSGNGCEICMGCGFLFPDMDSYLD
jgi:hypothetical protein